MENANPYLLEPMEEETELQTLMRITVNGFNRMEEQYGRVEGRLGRVEDRLTSVENTIEGIGNRIDHEADQREQLTRRVEALE